MSAKGIMDTSILRLRQEYNNAAAKFASMPEGVTIEEADRSPVYAEWIKPESADETKAILYFHGGGFVMGNVRFHRFIVGNLVKHAGYKALLFDYRHAPEFSAKAAVDDALEIYRWLLDQGYRPENIIFAGDSAGGGIEMGALLKLRDNGIPLPSACAAFSPSFACFGNGDPKQPITSPLYGDLTGLPPIMIHAGNDEARLDDTILFAEKADSFGVDMRVRIWREASGALLQVSSFIQDHMNKESGFAAAFLYMTMCLRY